MKNKETKIEKIANEVFPIPIIANFLPAFQLVKWEFNISSLCNGNFYVLYQNLMLAAPIKATELKTLGNIHKCQGLLAI